MTSPTFWSTFRVLAESSGQTEALLELGREPLRFASCRPGSGIRDALADTESAG